MTKSHQDQVYFRPRNWERWQDCRYKRAPFIKNFTDLLADPEYLSLTPNQRAILHGLWLHFGVTPRAYPLDTRLIGARLFIDSRAIGKALPVLLSKNFIELCNPSWSVSRQQFDGISPPETETETETETEKESLATLGTSPDGEPPGKEFDPAKQLFDFGVQLLASYGIKNQKARALIGKWRKVRKDPDLMAILLRAGETRRFEIVPFIEGSLRDQVKRPRSWVDREKQARDERLDYIQELSGLGQENGKPGQNTDHSQAQHSVSGSAPSTVERAEAPPSDQRFYPPDRQRISRTNGRGSGDSDSGFPGDLAEGDMANGRAIHSGPDGEHAQASNGANRRSAKAGPRKARCGPPAVGSGPTGDSRGSGKLALGLGDEES